MPDNKQIKLQFVVDEASIQKTRALIRELVSDLQNLNKAQNGATGAGNPGVFGGVRVGGGGTNSPESNKVLAKTPAIGKQLVQGFLDQKNIFKGIADGSKESLKVMTDSLRQAIDYQKREIKDLDNAATHLTETYEEMGREIAKLKSSGKWSNVVSELEGRRGEVGLQHQKIGVERSQASADQKILEGMVPGGAGSPPGGAMGSLMGNVSLPGAGGMGGAAMMAMAARIGGMVVMGTRAAALEAQAGNTGSAELQAERMSAIRPLYSDLRRGNVAGLVAEGMMSPVEREEMEAGINGKAARFLRFGGKLTDSAKTLIAGGGAGGLAGIWSDSHDKSLEMKARGEAIQRAGENMGPQEQEAMARFSGGELMRRVGLNRILGTGLSQGKDDTLGALETKLIGKGYSLEQYAGALTASRAGAGSAFAKKYAGSRMAAEAGGFAGYGELQEAAARAGADATTFGRGSLGAGIDINAGIRLGQTVIGSGFDPMGTTSGLGTLSAAQNGFRWTNTAADFNNVQRVGAGINAMSQVTTGGLDAYQKGRNLVGAIGILGKGSSVYAQDYLANGMNAKQMMDIVSGKGKLTKTAEALGIKKEDVKKELNLQMSSVFDRYVGGSGNNEMDKAIQRFRKSGKGFGEYLAGIKDKGARQSEQETLGSAWGLITHTGEEAGLGAAGLSTGVAMGGRLSQRKGGPGGGVGGSVEQKALSDMALASADATSKLKLMAKFLEGAFGENSPLRRQLEAASQEIMNGVMGKGTSATTNLALGLVNPMLAVGLLANQAAEAK